MKERRTCIPLYTDLTEKRVLVAGSGRAAEDMVRYLSGYTGHLFLLTGKEPEAVSPEEKGYPSGADPKPRCGSQHVSAGEKGYPCGMTPDKEDFLPGVAVLRKRYERSDLYGMDYVISVMEDREVNEDIYVTCRTLGIRVHIARDPGRCDFFLRPQ